MPLRTTPLDPTLVNQLKARRKALHWSQNALALQAGLTEGLIAKIETLRTPIRPAVKTKLESALRRGERALS